MAAANIDAAAANRMIGIDELSPVFGILAEGIGWLSVFSDVSEDISGALTDTSDISEISLFSGSSDDPGTSLFSGSSDDSGTSLFSVASRLASIERLFPHAEELRVYFRVPERSPA